VNGISFKVGKAEIVGFLGPNGAGKSTTMKIITGYLAPDEGEVKVCGILVNNNKTESKKKIGYLPESNPLYYEMYVREYLEFIANIHKLGKNTKARIEEVIVMTGLLPESKKKLGQLSKGYKQRAGLAAALLHDPEVLILDEPTSGLDPNQIVEIREVIRKLGEHKTVLFSSHILQEVEAICKRVIIINKGDIVADTDLETLQQSNKNGQMVKVEFKEAVEESLIGGMNYSERTEKINDRQYSIFTNEPENLRKELMGLSLKHNLNIVSLQSQANSLEDVFRDLTNNKN
ncbi:MAG: ATP-binding cassette domain-containing protein, partial [Chitinophagaceae bacterium]